MSYSVVYNLYIFSRQKYLKGIGEQSFNCMGLTFPLIKKMEVQRYSWPQMMIGPDGP